jgi:hypothetical protein
MTRALGISLMLGSVLAHAGECHPRITQSDAIRIAKQRIAQEFDASAVSYFGPYTATLGDCTWLVRAATPPRDVSGDVFVSVSARTGRARMEPRLRTDPRKLEKVYGVRK